MSDTKFMNKYSYYTIIFIKIGAGSKVLVNEYYQVHAPSFQVLIPMNSVAMNNVFSE